MPLLCLGLGLRRLPPIASPSCVPQRWRLQCYYTFAALTTVKVKGNSNSCPGRRRHLTSSPSSSQRSDDDDDDSTLPIHVLGSGSMGMLYASAIHHAKYQHRDCNASENWVLPPVTLLMRSHHKPHLISSSSSSSPAATQRDIMVCKEQWFAPVTVRKSPTTTTITTTTTTTDTTRPKEDIILQKSYIPVEFVQDSNPRTDSDYDEKNCMRSIRHEPIHCLLLVTKANDAISALESIWETRLSIPHKTSSFSSSSSISPFTTQSPTKIIILSNGALAIRDAIYNRFNHLTPPYTSQDQLLNGVQIILATTTHGSHKTQQNQLLSTTTSTGNYDITHAGVGSTVCTDSKFIDMCRSIGWEGKCVSMLDMHTMLWKKLAANCVINPLTAIHNIRNGQLLHDIDQYPSMKSITRQILEEVSIVATMEMKSLYEKNMTSIERGENINNEAHRDQWILSTTESLSALSLEKFVYQVMNSTKDNISSMLQDVRLGKTTEVQFLNGYVASIAHEKYGIKSPRNIEICHLVEERARNEHSPLALVR